MSSVSIQLNDDEKNILELYRQRGKIQPVQQASIRGTPDPFTINNTDNFQYGQKIVKGKPIKLQTYHLQEDRENFSPLQAMPRKNSYSILPTYSVELNLLKKPDITPKTGRPASTPVPRKVKRAGTPRQKQHRLTPKLQRKQQTTRQYYIPLELEKVLKVVVKHSSNCRQFKQDLETIGALPIVKKYLRQYGM